MRIVAAAALAALTLAACNQNSPQSASNNAGGGSILGGGGFPDLFSGSPYRADITMSHDGRTLPAVMMRSGHKVRMEMTTERGPTTIIMDYDTHRNVVITDYNGRQTAMVMPQVSFQDMAEVWRDAASKARRAGNCSVAGETGQVWENTENHNTACITSDGILLQTTNNGTPDWQTTRIQRGPQDPSLFAPPPGVQVMDMSAMAAQMRDAMQRARQAQESGGK